MPHVNPPRKSTGPPNFSSSTCGQGPVMDVVVRGQDAGVPSTWKVTTHGFSSVRHVTDMALNWLIVAPLYRLYRQGPSASGWLFWGNQSDAHVCATLAPNLPADFWLPHSSECKTMIESHFQSWLLLGTTSLYFVSLFVSLVYAVRCLGPQVVPWVFQFGRRCLWKTNNTPSAKQDLDP